MGTDDASDEGPTYKETTQLLSLLGRMTQLQHLKLAMMQLDRVTAVQQLSALTSSPQLTSLAVLGRYGMPITPHSLQHILPQGRQLMQLRVLKLQLEGTDGTSQQQCLDSDNIQHIAESCPCLAELSLKGVVSVGASLEPLVQHLQQSLKSLSVAGPAFDDTAAATVARLQQLQRLEWSDSHKLSNAGCLQLAALVNLRWLCIRSCRGLSHTIVPHTGGGGGFMRELETPEVSTQLHCL